MTKSQESYLFYHNPHCSKSRQALALLHELGIEPTVIEYLKTPPSVVDLEQILHKLGIEPRALIRTQESAYQDAGLDNPLLCRNELIAAMISHPILIERPILIAKEKAAVGRPPEKLLEILA